VYVIDVKPVHLSWLSGFTLAAVLGLSAIVRADDTAPRPVPLIFDTDVGNDVDDVLALGVIHALESRGECELLAVTITKDHPLSAAFVDAVNTFYGRGDVPVGMCKSGVTPEEGKFIGLAKTRSGDRLRYPHDLSSGDDARDAVAVLRKTLAAAPDQSVVFVQVGFSTNLANLLDSPPDDISPLVGVELVKKKARLLSIMAGAFEQIRGRDGQRHDHKEYNVVKDVASARKLAAEWPTPVVWSGYEIGLSVPYPHESIERDYDYVEHHPLAEAYRLYSPPPHNRPTWDLTSVLYAVRPDYGYFGLSAAGHVNVADDGLTTFEASDDGPHRYLTLTDNERIRVTEALVQLASQPPGR
jgi:inosine-uridine nucleoside N-ribohydrolase